MKWSQALNCWMVLSGVASLLFLLLYSNGLMSFSYRGFLDIRVELSAPLFLQYS